MGDTHRERAENLLHLLRIGFAATDYDSLTVRLLKEVVDGGFSLADIGSSEEELKNLAPT